MRGDAATLTHNKNVANVTGAWSRLDARIPGKNARTLATDGACRDNYVFDVVI